MLTQFCGESRVRGMKKHVANLPLDAIIGSAKRATQKAARDAVAAGRTVAGWKDGQVVEYGPGALPLSPIVSEEGGGNVRGAS